MSDWKRPLPHPMFADAVAAELIDRELEAGEKEKAHDTPFRFSSATDCSRKLALKYAGFEDSDPFDAPGLIVMHRGTVMHEVVQDAIGKKFPNAQFEGKGLIPDLISGHYDALIDLNGTRYLWELKNVGAFAFDKAIGLKRQGRRMTDPEGPRFSAVVQGALNAKAQDADVVVVAYIAMEAISVQLAASLGIGALDRIMAEWYVPREVWEPLADAEIARLETIRDSVRAGVIPSGAAVGDDGKVEHLSPLGARVPWRCSYCSMRTLCEQLSASAIPIGQIEKTERMETT